MKGGVWVQQFDRGVRVRAGVGSQGSGHACPDATLCLCCVLPSVILGKSHYVLYGLVAAMQPRMLVTFDEELRPLPVSVRVGQVRG